MDIERSIPVGIFERELFIARVRGEEIINFDVLRYVTESQLEAFRDFDNIREYCRDLWVEAVRAGNTEESLDDFTQSVIDDTDMDDEENYPFKDGSNTEKVSEEQYEQANKFIEEQYDDIVGTWEASGWYSPVSSFNKRKFSGWDFIFEDENAQKFAKIYQKMVERMGEK